MKGPSNTDKGPSLDSLVPKIEIHEEVLSGSDTINAPAWTVVQLTKALKDVWKNGMTLSKAAEINGIPLKVLRAHAGNEDGAKSEDNPENQGYGDSQTPKTSRGKKKQKSYTDEQLEAAINDIKTKNMSQMAAARAHNVPQSVLSRTLARDRELRSEEPGENSGSEYENDGSGSDSGDDWKQEGSRSQRRRKISKSKKGRATYTNEQQKMSDNMSQITSLQRKSSNSDR